MEKPSRTRLISRGSSNQPPMRDGGSSCETGSDISGRPPRMPRVVLVALLAVHTLLLGWGAVVHSPTIDEVEWLPGGWASWQRGNLNVVTRNPPHVGLLAALPLLLVEHDRTAAQAEIDDAREIGRDFIRTNGARACWLFTLGRWACIPFSLVGAITCYYWARKLYGDWAGVFAATLWCFCPNIIAHGQIVSHDIPATSLGLLACYGFWRWLREPGWTSALLAGLCLGLALLTKMTNLVYFVLWPMVWLVVRLTDLRRPGASWDAPWLAVVAQLTVMLLVALDVLNLGFGFNGSLARLDSYAFRSVALSGQDGLPGNRFAQSSIAMLPVPLPRPYVEGLDVQRSHLEGHLGIQATYLRGKWSTHGLPYYYLYALAIKVPIGTLCLILLAAWMRIRHLDGTNHFGDEVMLWVPALTILILVSASPGFTDHLRYILPCFPFVFIWISRLANLRWSLHKRVLTLAILATLWSIASSLWIYPHSLSYFNEFVGGPQNGSDHLLSSNIDYGQDLLYLKQWYDRHPEARPFSLAYWDMEGVDPRLLGIEFQLPPSGPPPGMAVDAAIASTLGPKPGWYALNVNVLHGDDWPGRADYPNWGRYGYFRHFTPTARAGYSVLIYHITPDQANRVRDHLGLPHLDTDPYESGAATAGPIQIGENRSH